MQTSSNAVSEEDSAMARLMSGHDAPMSGRGREWLYKADYPRRIDHYIDFFGSGLPRAEVPTTDDRLFVLRSLA
jgi:hypothetical protein